MGGMEIIKILENNPFKMKNFVLQPMRDTVKLREYLIENNYRIIYDFLIFDEGIFYNVLKVTKGKSNLKPLEIYFGKDNFDFNTQIFKEYLLTEKQKLELLSEKIDGLTKSNESHLLYINAALTYLEKLENGEIEINKRRKYL